MAVIRRILIFWYVFLEDITLEVVKNVDRFC
jgi:hypothetical protein